MICHLVFGQDGVAVKPDDYAASIKINYVRSWTATAPEVNPSTLVTRPLLDVKQATTYIDGLGRPVQSVIKQGAFESEGTLQDLVMPVYFDEYGRESRGFLPFSSRQIGTVIGSTSDGSFKINPFAQQNIFYSDPNGVLKGQGETHFYSKTDLEQSPLLRPVAALGPGKNWVGNVTDPVKRGTQYKYWFNTETDEVRIWEVTNATNAESFGAYYSNDIYAAATVSEDRLQVPVNANGDYVTYMGNAEGGVNFEYAVTDMTPTPTMTTNVITEGAPIVITGDKDPFGSPATTGATTVTTPAINSATAPTVSLSYSDLTEYQNTFTVTNNSTGTNVMPRVTGTGSATGTATGLAPGGTISVTTTHRAGQVGDGYNFRLTVTPTVSTPTVAPTAAAVANQLRIVEGQSRSLKHNISLPYSN